MNGIELRGLGKSYGSRTALSGLDLRIEAGTTYALLGPNGAGKTTTIGILSCLLKADRGQALVLGRDTAKEPREIKRLVGVSPQRTAVARRLGARENLLLVAGAYGLDRATARRRADELLDSLGLADRAEERADGLSGGMERRLSIAMALVADPPVLFLDEPTLGLDPDARRELWDLLLGYAGKKTILLTTHYLEEAERLASVIGILVKGELKIEGGAAELKAASGGSLEDTYLDLVRKEERS